MAPRVHINCACTLDGCIGTPGRKPLQISNAEDRARVHRLRSQSDAILVGVGTVLADDPKLTVKWDLVGTPGRNPLRVVLDAHLRTPAGALARNGTVPTLFFCAPDAPASPGIEAERVPSDPHGRLSLAHVLDALERRGVRTLLVEGGEGVLTSFLAQNLVDAATVFIAPRTLGRPEAPRLVAGPFDLGTHLRLQAAEKLGDGILATFARA